MCLSLLAYTCNNKYISVYKLKKKKKEKVKWYVLVDKKYYYIDILLKNG